MKRFVRVPVIPVGWKPTLPFSSEFRMSEVAMRRPSTAFPLVAQAWMDETQIVWSTRRIPALFTPDGVSEGSRGLSEAIPPERCA